MMTPENSETPGTDVPVTHEGAVQRLLERPVTDADLALGAEWAARPAVSSEGSTIGLLLFKLGEETAALPAKMLRRVTPWARPTPIPHRQTQLIRGLCNIRGELILCADLHQLLGIPPRKPIETPATDASDERRMVVIGSHDSPWVFEVDGLVGIERTASAGLGAPPITVELAIQDFTSGIASIRGAQVTVLDGDRVLSGFQAGLA